MKKQLAITQWLTVLAFTTAGLFNFNFSAFAHKAPPSLTRAVSTTPECQPMASTICALVFSMPIPAAHSREPC